MRHVIVWLAVALVIGCDSATNPEKTTNVSNPSGNLQSAAPTVSAEPSTTGSASTEDPSADRETKFTSQLGQLMASASQQAVNSQWHKALTTSEQILGLVESHYGATAWQTTNARLAVENARRKTELNSQQLAVLSEITVAEQTALRLLQLRHPDKALEKLVRASELAAQIWPENSQPVASLLYQEAQARRELGMLPEAESLYYRVLAIRESILGTLHPNYAETLSSLGLLYQQARQIERAETMLVRAAELTEEIWGPEHVRCATQWNNLGALWQDAGQYASAKDALSHSLAIREKSLGGDATECGDSRYNLGSVNLATGDLTQAADHFQKAATIHQRNLGAQHHSTIRSQNSLAACLFSQHKYAEAEVLMRQVAESQFNRMGKDHPDYGQALFRLAAALHAQQEFAAAEPLLQQALEIQTAAFGEAHPDVVATLTAYAGLLRQTGREGRAAAFAARARDAHRRSVASPDDRPTSPQY